MEMTMVKLPRMMTPLLALILVSSCEKGGSDPEPQLLGEVFFAPSVVGMLPGKSRTVHLKIQQTPTEAVELELATDAPDAVSVPDTVTFEPGEYVKEVVVEALAPGAATVTATYHFSETHDFEGFMEAYVGEAGRTCEGTVTETLSPGGKVELASGDAFVAFADDERFSELSVTISCADDIVGEGYVPLGPAVRFQPEHASYMREASFGVPVNAAMMPEGATYGNIVVFWEGPSLDARIVPVGNGWVRGDPTRGRWEFLSPRFGKYQAAVHEQAGSRTFERRYTFRGITGVSMGGGGAAYMGFRNHERFDFVAPLGGPANWVAMMHYVETYHLGGFCTALPDDGGDVGEFCEPEPPDEMYEFGQHFEHWFYPDGWDGQGGTFNREDYCQIFRDLSRAFGNPAFYNEDSSYLPPGVDWEWMQLPAADKCAEGGNVRLEGFYDRLYNPDGTYPVITFCDGAEGTFPDGTRDVGLWDPDGNNDYPLDITLAVDVNDNGRRDPHEPVLHQGYEPYEDVGADGRSSEDEPGYDPVTNPDPSGDDFDYQFNPSGTETNHLYDEGEPYLDHGLDGVAGTPQQSEGGYDYGEGNGAFDYNPNLLNYWDHDARHLIRAMTDEELRRVDVITDAGIRDLWDFAPGHNGIIGALLARGQPVGMFRDFAALYGSDDEEHFDNVMVDYVGLPKNYIVLYGDEDADEYLLERGDGGHVGTASQLLNRLATVTMAMSARWPGGDREIAQQEIDDDHMFTFDFESHGRMSQTSIFLPPGYYDPENMTSYYPVIYFLHGYGQEPNDLVISAIVFGNNMISDLIVKDDRMQKVIMVFPDGRCRYEDGALDYEKECLKGSFYADSKWEGPDDGPMMEAILLDLMDYVDATYRTRPEQTVTYTY
jgi:S-formylglutathione hydrolase FrmB